MRVSLQYRRGHVPVHIAVAGGAKFKIAGAGNRELAPPVEEENAAQNGFKAANRRQTIVAGVLGRGGVLG